VLDKPCDSHSRQSETNTSYLASHYLFKSEKILKNYNHWVVGALLSGTAITQETRVLDFGAGIGTLSQIFYETTGIKPECVEVDPEQKKILDERGWPAYSGLDEIDGTFDFIFASNVLEHIADDQQALAAIRSKLNDSGVLAIFVPAFQVIWSALDVQFGHYRRYNKQMMIQKLEQSGYTVKSIRYCDSVGFLLSFLFKHIGDKNQEPSPAALEKFQRCILPVSLFDTFLLPISKIMDALIFGAFGKNLMVIATPRK